MKAAYQDRFPVKNIDPAMDWKMTQQVRVNVSVSEDTGIDYTIRIYDKNPLISRSSAKLLTEGTANNTTVFTTVMDCPSVLTSAFVCRTDAHSRNIVKYVSIQNGQLHAAFGSSPQLHVPHGHAVSASRPIHRKSLRQKSPQCYQVPKK